MTNETMDDYDAGFKKGYEAGANEINLHKVELQIRNMLDKYQLSDFTSTETRRCLAEVITSKLKQIGNERNN